MAGSTDPLDRRKVATSSSTYQTLAAISSESRTAMPYSLGENGEIDVDRGATLEEGLRQRLRQGIDGGAPVDNPIVHVTGWQAGRLEHDKTDVFLDSPSGRGVL
jgi:hypothetical protein